MRYWGKLLGLALGIVSSAGIWGMIMGLLMGHWIDKAWASRRRDYFSAQSTRQSLFFLTTFQAMGHLTKSKGRVTEADIKIATKMMDRLELFGEARSAAQQAFREGKAGHFPLRIKLRKLRDACLGRFDLIKMFLEIQLQVAFVDGVLHPNERRVLYVIADELGVTREQFEFFLRNMEGTSGQQSRQNQSRQNGKSHQRRNNGYSNGHSYGGQRPVSPPRGLTVESACRTLGVRSSDDAATIKRAYRKLMNEHHPDKLVAKKLSPRMMEMAKRKAQDIQAAYELLKSANQTK
ncbi:MULTISPECIES: co-chaperone DjlA [Pectobacterium]|uniref:co-chaperone DjlA n=1 Tax=Pectobacterium TaxID=122277 RepID=UPI0015DEA556|nr:co-chaperone DjlA [Pectobacterium sp. CFBP8739]MBA0166710.1 co-chaperone DjlA [Pectobacterium sp. CFBP8739]